MIIALIGVWMLWVVWALIDLHARVKRLETSAEQAVTDSLNRPWTKPLLDALHVTTKDSE